MSDFAIETHHLTKSFGGNIAVKDLSLQIERGEVFGFLGPNGAGKTTSVKMLLGLITPTSGDARMLGKPIGDDRARSKVGFLPEHFRFHDWLTSVEFLRLHANLYHMDRQYASKKVDELLELVGLDEHRDKKLRAFSKGMLQRIGLAQTLLNDPELVILDEPTSGLDPVGRRMVRDIIRGLSEKGTTVFLNSHFLSEVEITCHRVTFIKFGETIHTSSLGALMDGEVTVEVLASNLTSDIVDGLSRWTEFYRRDGDYLAITLTGEDALPEINRYLVNHGVDVYAIRPQHISLEELFLKVVGTDGGL